MNAKAEKTNEPTLLIQLIDDHLSSEQVKEMLLNDPVNQKIQRKFDSVFPPTKKELMMGKNESEEDLGTLLFMTSSSDESEATRTQMAPTKVPVFNPEPSADDSIQFHMGEDLGPELNAMEIDSTRTNESVLAPPLPPANAEEGMHFDFEDDHGLNLSDKNESPPDMSVLLSSENTISKNELHFEDTHHEDLKIGELTGGHDLPSVEFGHNELAPAEETQDFVEATLKDIVRPSSISSLSKIDPHAELAPEMFKKSSSHEDKTGEFNLEFKNDDRLESEFTDAELFSEDEVLGQAVVTERVSKDHLTESRTFKAIKAEIQESVIASEPILESNYDDHFEFSSDQLDHAESEVIQDIPVIPPEVIRPRSMVFSAPASEEESLQTQAIVRELRLEREDLFKNTAELTKQLEVMKQENLSLRAYVDELKIEVAILKKRHVNEIEELKSKSSLAEEKKAMAEEKVRILEMQKNKLENKTRVDVNQIRHREKELESKLELLAMDSAGQIKGRDQKILDLRRKIDSLEFNMENMSVREQKSIEDRDKLEEKLNKIMKTLRHSIRNLEDDLDLEADSENKENN